MLWRLPDHGSTQFAKRGSLPIQPVNLFPYRHVLEMQFGLG
jgi:hypothetical protein